MSCHGWNCTNSSAHVRASTMAGAPSEDNCHPWIFDRLMVGLTPMTRLTLADLKWMHNGEITGFRQIKRALQMSLPEELFLYPSGYTDAEWAFMLFLSKLKNPHARKFTHTELKNAMMETIATLNTMLKEAGIVSSQYFMWLLRADISDWTQSPELCCQRWRLRDRDSIHHLPHLRGILALLFIRYFLRRVPGRWFISYDQGRQTREYHHDRQ